MKVRFANLKAQKQSQLRSVTLFQRMELFRTGGKGKITKSVEISTFDVVGETQHVHAFAKGGVYVLFHCSLTVKTVLCVNVQIAPLCVLQVVSPSGKLYSFCLGLSTIGRFNRQHAQCPKIRQTQTQHARFVKYNQIVQKMRL